MRIADTSWRSSRLARAVRCNCTRSQTSTLFTSRATFSFLPPGSSWPTRGSLLRAAFAIARVTIYRRASRSCACVSKQVRTLASATRWPASLRFFAGRGASRPTQREAPAEKLLFPFFFRRERTAERSIARAISTSVVSTRDDTLDGRDTLSIDRQFVLSAEFCAVCTAEFNSNV